MGIERDGQQHEGLELLIGPGPFHHPPTIWIQHRQCRCWISLGQVHAGPAEWKIVRLSQVGGSLQIAQLQQRLHPGSGDLSHTMDEIILAYGLLDLSQHGGRAGHISPGQFQAGQEQFAEYESVNRGIVLPRQLKAPLGVLLAILQIVPRVEDAGQA